MTFSAAYNSARPAGVQGLRSLETIVVETSIRLIQGRLCSPCVSNSVGTYCSSLVS